MEQGKQPSSSWPHCCLVPAPPTLFFCQLAALLPVLRLSTLPDVIKRVSKNCPHKTITKGNGGPGCLPTSQAGVKSKAGTLPPHLWPL